MNGAEFTAGQEHSAKGTGGLGHVVAQSPGRAVVMGRLDNKVRMGERVLFSGVPQVLGIVTGFETPVSDTDPTAEDIVFVDVRLVGTLRSDGTATRGSAQPAMGAEAFRLPRSVETAEAAMGRPVRVGSHDGGFPVCFDAASLLGRTVTITGDAESGKSSTLVAIVRALLSDGFPARLVLIDPEGEFSASLGRAASVVDAADGLLPISLLTDDEFAALLGRIGEPLSADEVRAVARLREVAGAGSDLETLREVCGRLRSSDIRHAERFEVLAERIRILSEDDRYTAFNGQAVRDSGVEGALQRFFRLPDGRPPASVVQLHGLAPELRPLAVSILMRLGLAVATGSAGAVPVVMALDRACEVFTELPDVKAPAFGIIASGHGLVPSTNGITFLHRIRNTRDNRRVIPEGDPMAEDIAANARVLSVGEAMLIDPDYPWPIRFSVTELPGKAIPRRSRPEPPRDAASLLIAISEACTPRAES